ncbi:MAG: endolytic transglycosylase MltG [Clostridiales Family XIII bacterium]|jgi:hypothetical protein|nr:endolytic transglycosylase MltG [Clostridiales Family XIII bacterium]
MQKLKDIIYNTSDIIVVLIIVAAAALLIWSRIGVIMGYPSGSQSGPSQENPPFLSGESETTGDAINPEGADENTADGADSETDAAQTGDSTSGALAPPPVSGEVTNFSLYIAYGETGEQIANKLLAAGLIKTKEEFYDAIAAVNAATRLQAGTFIIPSNVTVEEIVDTLTK